MVSKTVSSDFRLLFEVKNHTKKSTKKSTLATYFWEGVRNRSGTLFSSILDGFLEHFWYDSGGVFCGKRGFTCMGAHFSKVSVFVVLSLLLAGISEIAVLLAWELSFREFTRHFGYLFSNTKTVKKCSFRVSLFFPFEQGRG